MTGFNNYLAATFLSAAVLCPCPAQAMEIQQFDKMADKDQGEYVVQLIEGARKVLRASGRADLAEKVARLFTTDDPQSNISIGMTQFEITLAKGRVADLDRIAKDPNARRLEVEDVMIVALKKNGIVLPAGFLTVMKNFKPKFPPRKN
jgi:hypothetical protein